MSATTMSRTQARRSQLVASLFPSGVAAAEMRETGDVTTLLAQERACCAGFAARRLAEFAAGRQCAHAALAELGSWGDPLLIGTDRLPTWPAAMCGSISHTHGFCAAVVGRRRDFAAVGFDAERVGRVTLDVWPHVFVAEEVAYLDSLSMAERARAATVIFAAKEAFYKCQFVVSPRWLDFTDVAVALRWDDARRGELVVRAVAELHPALMQSLQSGRFVLDGELAFAGFALRAAREEPA